MRLLKFLNEKNVGSINAVKRECKEFLTEWQKLGVLGGALYRGMSVDVKKVEKFLPLLYRLPKDTPFAASNYLDQLYKKTTGIPLRSTSVFASHDKSATEVYGNSYYFAPTGKYSLWYNSKIRDAFVDVFTPPTVDFIPKLAEPGQPLNVNSIISAAKTPIKPDPKTGSLLRTTAKHFLLPSVAALTDAERIKILKSFSSGAYLNGNMISEGILDKIAAWIDKKNKEAAGLKYDPNTDLYGDKISPEKAYKIFWKPCFDELEFRIFDLFAQTRRVTLAQACSKDVEVMVQCESYFLINSMVVHELWT